MNIMEKKDVCKTYKDMYDILTKADIFFDNSAPDHKITYNGLLKLIMLDHNYEKKYDGIRVCEYYDAQDYLIETAFDTNKKYIKITNPMHYEAEKIKKITIKLKNGSTFLPKSYKIYIDNLPVDLSRYNNIMMFTQHYTFSVGFEIPNHITDDNIEQITVDIHQYILNVRCRNNILDCDRHMLYQDILTHVVS